MEGNTMYQDIQTAQGQSVYPDIALYISGYCVYCILEHSKVLWTIEFCLT